MAFNLYPGNYSLAEPCRWNESELKHGLLRWDHKVVLMPLIIGNGCEPIGGYGHDYGCRAAISAAKENADLLIRGVNRYPRSSELNMQANNTYIFTYCGKPADYAVVDSSYHLRSW